MSVPMTGSDPGRSGARTSGKRRKGADRPSVPPDRGSDRAAAYPQAGSDRPAERTVIAPGVVATVAGVAARGVRGVHTLRAVADSTRGLGQLRGALPSGGDAPSYGVDVELGEVQAAFDLGVVVEYGVPVARLAGDVRERVIDDVERLTGFEVTEVNIAVVDVHLDEEDEA